MTGVHRGQHIDGLGAAHLAEDDAVGAHTKGITHQRALRDLAAPFDVRGSRFEAQHVRLPQLQFGRVFDRYDALLFGNEAGQDVEQRRFAAAGAA